MWIGRAAPRLGSTPCSSAKIRPTRSPRVRRKTGEVEKVFRSARAREPLGKGSGPGARARAGKRATVLLSNLGLFRKSNLAHDRLEPGIRAHGIESGLDVDEDHVADVLAVRALQGPERLL